MYIQILIFMLSHPKSPGSVSKGFFSKFINGWNGNLVEPHRSHRVNDHWHYRMTQTYVFEMPGEFLDGSTLYCWLRIFIWIAWHLPHREKSSLLIYKQPSSWPFFLKSTGFSLFLFSRLVFLRCVCLLISGNCRVSYCSACAEKVISKKPNP